MRQLNAKLAELIDSRIAPPTSHTLEELIIRAARTLVGTTEASAMPIVDLIRSTIAHPWGEAWCMDFVQTCIAYAEAVDTRQSDIVSSESVLDTWARSKLYSSTLVPKPGDVIIWQLGQSGEGHCGIITGMDSLCYDTIEGNTSDTADIDRNGRGVFAKRRAKGGTKTFTEVGFLRVFP